MKKILIIISISFLFLTTLNNNNAYAEIVERKGSYLNGLLDDENLNPIVTGNGNYYDNNQTSTVYANSPLKVKFPIPVKISDIYIFKSYDHGNAYISFKFSNGSEMNRTIKLYSNNLSSKIIEYPVNIDDVIEVNVQGSNTLRIGEIEFYGSYDDEQLEEIQNVENVKNVNVQAKYNRVDLSWELPQQENFHHVKIYRKTIEELKEIETANIFTHKVYAEEAEEGEYDELFETNGTYFNDLTVKPRSEYEYKLTTVTTYGLESQGVFVKAETPDEPDPVIVGGGYTETDGDYVYTWTEPTEGQVKIIVGGEEYATVEASQGEITIPKEDMKYILGKPDVSLVPISQYGKEGNEYNPTNPLKNIRLPFDADGLLKSGFSLLTVVGPFILLALSFILVPRLIRIIKRSIENKKVRSGIR